jgi:hypothetical protein|tara:strand:- start:14219 stop:16195 length:1977 start_codon:yes stop_codon:yes gene_type:complete
MSTKDDINIKLKSQNRQAGEVKQEFKTITTRGVDADGFSYTEVKRVPIETATGDEYQDDAITAREGNYVKKATKVGVTAGEINGGVLSVDQPNEVGDEILNESIGEITESIGIEGLIDPSTSLTYGPGSLSLGFDSNTSDAAIIAGAGTAAKLGGDSSQPLSSILDTLTGLGTATGKLTNKNSGLAVVGAGGISGIVSGVESGIAKVNQLATDIQTAVGSIGSASDATQFTNVAQSAAKDAFSDVATSVTPVAELKSGGGDISPEDLREKVSNASGFEGLTAKVTSAKDTLTKFPAVSNFIDDVKDLTTDIQNFSDNVTDFNTNLLTNINKGLGSVTGGLQDIVEGITGKAENTINGLGGVGFAATPDDMKTLINQVMSANGKQVSATIRTTTSKNDSVSPRMQKVVAGVKDASSPQDLSDKVDNAAREQGIPESEIAVATGVIERADAEIKGLDTTVSGSVVIDQSFFQESTPVDATTQKWAGRNTKDDAFTYVSSVEELEAEIRSIERTLDQVIIHATETTTDKNIGSIEINNVHNELGFNGIGYHYVIRRDGRLQRGRPINKAGEHVDSLDRTSIGLVLVGGLNCSSGEPNPTSFRSAQSFTISQYNTLEKFLQAFYRKYPGGKVHGHNEIDATELDPYFDVADYIESTFRKINR